LRSLHEIKELVSCRPSLCGHPLRKDILVADSLMNGDRTIASR